MFSEIKKAPEGALLYLFKFVYLFKLFEDIQGKRNPKPIVVGFVEIFAGDVIS